jgi:hypothetical protein
VRLTTTTSWSRLLMVWNNSDDNNFGSCHSLIYIGTAKKSFIHFFGNGSQSLQFTVYLVQIEYLVQELCIR